MKNRLVFAAALAAAAWPGTAIFSAAAQQPPEMLNRAAPDVRPMREVALNVSILEDGEVVDEQRFLVSPGQRYQLDFPAAPHYAVTLNVATDTAAAVSESFGRTLPPRQAREFAFARFTVAYARPGPDNEEDKPIIAPNVLLHGSGKPIEANIPVAGKDVRGARGQVLQTLGLSASATPMRAGNR